VALVERIRAEAAPKGSADLIRSEGGDFPQLADPHKNGGDHEHEEH